MTCLLRTNTCSLAEIFYLTCPPFLADKSLKHRNSGYILLQSNIVLPTLFIFGPPSLSQSYPTVRIPTLFFQLTNQLHRKLTALLSPLLSYLTLLLFLPLSSSQIVLPYCWLTYPLVPADDSPLTQSLLAALLVLI